MTYNIPAITIVLALFITWLILPTLLHLTDKSKVAKKWKIPEIKHMIPTKWGWIVSHPENLKLGENTDIGFGTYIQAEYGVDIGKNVQIGSHCAIYSKNTIDEKQSRIIIKDNVRIGAGTVILPNKKGYPILHIGKNSVIGALSLVKDNIPDNSIYAGVPAKPIKGSEYKC